MDNDNDDIVQKREKSVSKIIGNCDYAVDLWNQTYENGKTYCSGQKRFYCIDCGKSFTRKSSLIVHQRIHTGEKLFMCAECGKSFGLKSSMVRHMRTHTPKTLNICPDCGKCFSTYSSLFQHQKLHRKERPHKCTHCDKSFAQTSQLMVHQRIHKRTELLEISECKESYGKCQSRAQQVSVCLQCGKSFRDPSSLKRHQRIHRVQTAFPVDRDDEFTRGVSVDEKTEYHVSLHKQKKCLHQRKNKSSQTERKTHHGDKCFLCIDCGKSFTRKSSLIVHQRIHTGEKLFMCTECGKRFGLKSSLVRHMRTHSPKVLNICPDCGKCFGHYSSLFQHLKGHKREKPFKCSHCQKTFSRSSQLVVHVRTHKAEKLCPKSEPTEDCELNTYVRDNYVCLECGKRFKKQSAFIKHQRIHIDNRYMEVQKIEQYDVFEKNNPDGGENSYIPVTLGNNADRKVSSGEKRFLCLDCGKSFTRKSSLIVHKRIHTGEKLFACAECGKQFGLKSSLVRHMRTHSPKVLNICSDCGKCFSRYSSLFQHQKVHKRDKPYKCLHCQKKFSRTSQLAVHQRTHRVEKLCPKSHSEEDYDYQDSGETNCMENPDCQENSDIQDWENENNSKTFSVIDNFKLLQSDNTEGINNNAVSEGFESKGVEKGECIIDSNSIPKQRSSSSKKPYHCIQCGKNFTRKSSLIVHQRIHSGERLFMCTDCGKRFSFKSSLVRHLKTHIGETLNLCSQCNIYFSRYGDLLLHLENHKDQQQIGPIEEHSLNTDEVETTVALVKEQESTSILDKDQRSQDNDCHLPIASLTLNGYKDPPYVDTMEKIQKSSFIKQESPETICTVGEDLESSKNQEITTYPYSLDLGVEFDLSKSLIEESPKKVERTDESEISSQPPILNGMTNSTIGVNLWDGTQQIHKRTQSGENRVLCTECGKSFTRKSSLIVHQRIHTGEKLFMCTECGKRFGLKSSMVRHMRTHSSAVFTCTKCGKNFRDYSKFLQHQTCHTAEWPCTDLSAT